MPTVRQLFAATRNDTVVAIDVATAAVVSTVTTDPTPDTVSTPALAVAADGTIYQTDSTDNALRILHMGTVTGPTNNAPVIGTPIVGTPNAQTGVVTGTIVASDADGDTLTYSVAAAATSGTVSVGSNGSFTYTPSLQARQAAGPNTVDQFTVTVSDGQASVTSTVTVKVLPLAVNHAPTVGAPVVGTPDAQTGVVTGSIVASDSDGDTLTYTVTTAPTSRGGVGGDERVVHVHADGAGAGSRPTPTRRPFHRDRQRRSGQRDLRGHGQGAPAPPAVSRG